MSKRLKNKYKIIKLYKEDLWGKLATNVFKSTKVNKILIEKPLEKFNFGIEVRNIKNRLKKYFNIYEKFKPVFKFSKRNRYQYDKIRQNNKAYKLFRRNKNERYNKYKKALKGQIKMFKETRARPSFNFRTDIGKPKRKFKKLSSFGKTLKYRHKLRKFFSGTISVKQLRNYIEKVHRYNSLSLNFCRIMESRLDTIIYRLNISYNSGEIRQLINHGNFLMNGRLINFSNYNFRIFDIFSVKNKGFFFKKILRLKKKKRLLYSVPRFMEINFRIMSAVFFRNPLPKHVFFPSKFEPLFLVSSGKKFRKR